MYQYREQISDGFSIDLIMPSNTVLLLLAILSAVCVFAVLYRDKAVDFWSLSYFWIILTFVFFCFAGLSNTLFSMLRNLTTTPKYEALVVKPDYEVSTTSDYDKESGRTYTTTYYRALVQFTDEKGSTILLPTDLGRQSPYTLNSKIKIRYRPEMKVVQTQDTQSIMMLLMIAVGVYITGLASLGAVFYTFKNRKWFDKIVQLAISTIIPILLIGFWLLLSQALYDVVFGTKRISGGALLVLFFFWIVLTTVLVFFVKQSLQGESLFGNKRNLKRRNN